MIHFDDSIENLTTIKVMGIGGGGCNAVDRMIESGFDAVQYACVNTDVQALISNKALEKIQIGPEKTQGLGAGGNPEIGRVSAQESREEIRESLEDTDILFLLAGFGGGTGTGALPVITEVAKELDILTIPVVTKPFQFEGRKRTHAAEEGIAVLSEKGVSIIVVPNEKLLGIIAEDTSVQDAFLLTDRYLMSCVESLYCLLSQPGLINVDFADVNSVMRHPGNAVLGQGTGEGNQKVSEAVNKALSSPILERQSLGGAKGLLVHIRGGKDVGLMEVNKAMTEVEALTDPEANIIFGTTLDEKAENKAHVTIIATGLTEKEVEEEKVVVQEELVAPEEPEVEPEKTEQELKPIPAASIRPEKIKGPRQHDEEPPVPVVEQPELTVVEENVEVPEEQPLILEFPVEEEPVEESVEELVEEPVEKPTVEKPSKEKQIVLNFKPEQKGRFDKMEPTLYDGEDLDIPTFIRKKKLFGGPAENEV